MTEIAVVAVVVAVVEGSASAISESCCSTFAMARSRTASNKREGSRASWLLPPAELEEILCQPGSGVWMGFKLVSIAAEIGHDPPNRVESIEDINRSNFYSSTAVTMGTPL